MFFQDLKICLQQSSMLFTQEKPDACFLNPPCGCSNPGKELKCEDCSHLEACLSRCKAIQVSNSQKKI